MKKNIFSFLIILIFSIEATAQLKFHSITLYSDYSYSTVKRLAVSKADALGGSAELRLNLTKELSISLIGGYQLFNLNQDSAVTQWNWKFWTERYYNRVRENLRDSVLAVAASLNPFQKMDYFPLFLTFNVELNPIENFFIRIDHGIGRMFYTRRLYMEESWTKYFKSIDYTFDYTYYNFAPPKEGKVDGLLWGLNLMYQFSDSFALTAKAQYISLLDDIDTTDDLNYLQLPLKNLFSIKLGLTFLY